MSTVTKRKGRTPDAGKEDALIRAGAEWAAKGEPYSLTQLAAMAGVAETTSHYAVCRLIKQGRWPFPAPGRRPDHALHRAGTMRLLAQQVEQARRLKVLAEDYEERRFVHVTSGAREDRLALERAGRRLMAMLSLDPILYVDVGRWRYRVVGEDLIRERGPVKGKYIQWR